MENYGRFVEINSLCIVLDNQSSNSANLKRLADIIDEKIEPFNVNYEKSKFFDNRHYLYYKENTFDVGFIGIWSWLAIARNTDYEKDYIKSTYLRQYELIDIIIFNEYYSLEDIVEEIKSGINLDFSFKKVFFCIKINSDDYLGVLCKKEDFDVNSDKYYLSENISTLPKYTIKKEDIFFTENNRAFYKKFDMETPYDIYEVKNMYETIRHIFLKRISWTTVKGFGLNKNEWNKFRTILNMLPDKTFYEEIVNSYKISKTDVETSVKEFILNIDKYINCNDIENNILQSLIENNIELQEKFKNIAYEYWKNENQNKIKEAEKILKNIDGEISIKNDELKNLKQKIDNSNDELNKIKNKILEYEKVSDEVKLKVDERMEYIKQNVSDFICDIAFTTPFSTQNLKQNNEILNNNNIYIPGNYIKEDIDEIENWKDFLEVLSEELIEAGVIKNYAEDLSIYLYSAFRSEMPILLAGPCGESIANAFSMSLYGKTAGVFDCNKKYSENAINDIINSQDNIIIIKNPFNAEWIYSVFDLLLPAKKQYFLVIPCAEDLTIEPRGIFNYMLPILTELFVDKVPTNEFTGSKMSSEFLDFNVNEKYKNIHIKNLKNFGISKMAIERYNYINSIYHTISEKENKDMDYLIVLLSCAYINQQQTKFIEYIEKEENISKLAKNDLKSFLGEYE